MNIHYKNWDEWVKHARMVESEIRRVLLRELDHMDLTEVLVAVDRKAARERGSFGDIEELLA